MGKISIIELKVPNLGDAEETEIIEISVSPGDDVNLNDPILVLESEKAAMEIPSDYQGKIKEILVKDCLLYTSPSPRDQRGSRMPSTA